MNIAKRSSRNGILTLVIAISVGLHVIALVAFGAFKLVESITREEQVFQAPPIEQVPVERPDYTVNLEQRNQTSSPPRPNPITVQTPDVSLPALNIDVNVDSSSAYGRGTGGFGSGTGGGIREMALDNLKMFGKEFAGGTDRVMFVIDMSGSMVMAERGAEGYKIAVEEIIETLGDMVGRGSFNIIAFAGDTDLFRGSWTNVTEARIKDAEQWLMARDPSPVLLKARRSDGRPDWPEKHQGTYAGEALQKAFSKRPNSIIFLSDGDPTGMSEEEIHKMVADKQSSRKIPINTISYKSKSGRKFLQTLAEQNNGTYTEVR